MNIRSVSAIVVAMMVAMPGLAAFESKVDVPCVGEVAIFCKKPGGWRFATEARTAEKDVAVLSLRLTADKPAEPPRFEIAFAIDQIDMPQRWTGVNGRTGIPPDWSGRIDSKLCGGLPLVSLLDDADRNRFAMTVSEAKRRIVIKCGLREDDAKVLCGVEFFKEPEAPLSEYEVQLRFDRRGVFFGEAIADGIEWIGLKSAHVPGSAFEPLYSTWYAFHQDVTDRDIEAECAIAAKMGMKTIILDDGWQMAGKGWGYATCGDWKADGGKFPDMAAHVAKVHALDMKYLVWFAPPFVGFESANYRRFAGKYLYADNGRKAGILDPRFPEVREFLCEVLSGAVRKWDIDGLKLDFIYCFTFRGDDPAVKEDYAGRDVKSLPEAVDRLMREIHAAVTAIKPDALIEYRQPYMGPGMRQYGNLFRAHDCAGDLSQNRCSIANLRLTSGGAAVHADPLMWNVKDTPENAARFVLSSIFSTAQYSVMLRTLPQDHRRMLEHWIAFSLKHRESLLKGKFHPHGFGHNYPVIEAESAKERIVAVYDGESVARCGRADRDIYVINATAGDSLVIDSEDEGEAEIYDTFGDAKGKARLNRGIQRVEIPHGGYVLMRKGR